MKLCVQQLNALYRNHLALYELQYEKEGFEWVEMNKRSEGVIAYRRKAKDWKNDVVVILNMTPVPRHDFPIHLYGKKQWKEIFNSDEKHFWGVGDLYNSDIQMEPQDEKEEWYKLNLQLPALSAIVIG